MPSVQLFTPDDGGWSSQDLAVQAIPSLAHWVQLDDAYYRVTAVVHTALAVEVYAVPDDFTKLLDRA